MKGGCGPPCGEGATVCAPTWARAAWRSLPAPAEASGIGRGTTVPGGQGRPQVGCAGGHRQTGKPGRLRLLQDHALIFGRGAASLRHHPGPVGDRLPGRERQFGHHQGQRNRPASLACCHPYHMAALERAARENRQEGQAAVGARAASDRAGAVSLFHKSWERSWAGASASGR